MPRYQVAWSEGLKEKYEDVSAISPCEAARIVYEKLGKFQTFRVSAFGRSNKVFKYTTVDELETCREKKEEKTRSTTAKHLIERVLSGESPNSLCDMLVEFKITRGMINSFGRGRVKYRCTNGDCGLNIPIYPGAFPKLCPNCGGKLRDVK